MGGFYERLVGLTKRSLRKAIGRNLLSFDKLQTVIKEAEAVINTRPLLYIGDDINSNIALTPSHFLCLNPYTGIPNSDADLDQEYKLRLSTAETLLAIWKKGQKLLNSFWNIWREQYLTSLRERTQVDLEHGRTQAIETCKVGDVVLIKDNVPRGDWRFGQIEELILSKDGFVRSAKVRTQTGKTLNRPLCLLYPLETSDKCCKTTSDNTLETEIPTNKRSSKIQRNAAKKALDRIKEM